MGRSLCDTMWRYRKQPKKAEFDFGINAGEWARGGAIILRLGLTAQSYFSAFVREERNIPGGICRKTLCAEGWGTKLAAAASEALTIERESTMDPKKAVQADLDWAMTKIFDMTGRLVVDEEAMPALRTTLYAIEDYMKLCLAPRDPEILAQFGQSGCQQLEDSPAIEEAIHTGSFGFDLHALMDIRAYFWSVTKKNLKRTWYPSR